MSDAAVSALIDRGRAFEAAGDALQADEAYAAAIRLDPDAPEPYRRAADLALRASAAAARAGRADLARELHAGAYRYLGALGVRLIERRLWNEAETILRRAAELAPDEAAARIDLGRCLYEQGRLAEAESAIAAGLRLAPGLALAHYHRGMLCLRQGRTREAEAALRQALALEPALAAAQDRLAELGLPGPS